MTTARSIEAAHRSGAHTAPVPGCPACDKKIISEANRARDNRRLTLGLVMLLLAFVAIIVILVTL